MKTVLLAEDSEDDIFIMRSACKTADVAHRLHVVTDGEMAVDYLSGNGNFADRANHPLPNILFLDLKIPKMDGFQVLKWIRSNPDYIELPVVMLTSSSLMTDVHRAYQLGCTSYLKKNSNHLEFRQAIQIILKYWLEMNVTRF